MLSEHLQAEPIALVFTGCKLHCASPQIEADLLQAGDVAKDCKVSPQDEGLAEIKGSVVISIQCGSDITARALPHTPCR